MHPIATIYEVSTGRVLHEWLDSDPTADLEEGEAIIVSQVADVSRIGSDAAWVLDGVRVLLTDSPEARTARDAALLPEIRQGALDQLATDAETARTAPLTSGAGKLAAYERKAAEAKTWQAATDAGENPDLANYPWLSDAVSRGLWGSTAADVVTLWLGLNAAWEAHAIAVEAVYETAKAAVDAAADAAGVQAVLDGLIWPEVPVA